MEVNAVTKRASGQVPTTGRSRNRRGAVGDVTDTFLELLRTVRRSKVRMLAIAGSDVGSATRILLSAVAEKGPMRASALASCVQSDLSTVSRQVAVLVGEGVLERRADPVDGRASLLVVTEEGRSVVAAHEHARAEFFTDVFDGWDVEDLRTFGSLLARFTAAYDRAHVARTGQDFDHPALCTADSEGKLA